MKIIVKTLTKTYPEFTLEPPINIGHFRTRVAEQIDLPLDWLLITNIQDQNGNFLNVRIFGSDSPEQNLVDLINREAKMQAPGGAVLPLIDDELTVHAILHPMANNIYRSAPHKIISEHPLKASAASASAAVATVSMHDEKVAPTVPVSSMPLAMYNSVKTAHNARSEAHSLSSSKRATIYSDSKSKSVVL